MSRRIPNRIRAHVLESPWAITEGGLQTIIQIVSRENDIDLDAIAAKLGRPLDNTRSVSIRDGVATIPMDGPLVRHASMFDAISGATSYEDLATDLTSAVENPVVKAILLEIDSPGGEVAGVNELAQLISQANDAKPVTAFVGGLGASAAYWLASAAGEIVTSETGILGSIGVRATIVDRRQADASKGVTTHDIVSSQSPAKTSDPATTEGRARIQSTVDSLADVFVRAVATNRGVSQKTVLENYGGGDVMVGQAAVDAGLADRIGTYESVHAEMASRSPRPRSSGRTAAAPSPQEHHMKENDAPPLTAAAVAAEHPEWVAAWREEGATAEHERLQAIESLPLAGHADLVKLAKANRTCTAATLSQQVLVAEAAQRQAKLDGLKSDEKKLDGGPKPSPQEGPASEPSARDAGRAIAKAYVARNTHPSARS